MEVSEFGDSGASVSGTFFAAATVQYGFSPPNTNSTTNHLEIAVDTPNLTTTLTVDTAQTYGTLTIGSCTDSTSIGIVNLVTGGSLALTTLNIGRYGNFNQSGGILAVSGATNIGYCGTGGTFNQISGISSLNTVSIANLGSLNMTAGTLTASAITINPGGALNQAGGTFTASSITNNGTLAFLRTDTFTLNSTISGGGTLAHLGAGTTTLTHYNATGSILINAGTLVFDTTAGARRTSDVLVQASSVSITNPASGTSILDITNHDMMIANNNTASYAAIKTLVANGMNSLLGTGSSTGPQITSSTAVNNTGNFGTILVAFEMDSTFGGGAVGDGSATGSSYGSYTDNVTVTQPGTVMIKYGYYGDIDFSGKVDAGDVNLVTGSVGTTTPGAADPGFSYLLGDIDANGQVDAGDINLVLGALGAGSGGSNGNPLGSLESTTVPEPGTLSVLGLAAALLFTRRPKARQSRYWSSAHTSANSRR